MTPDKLPMVHTASMNDTHLDAMLLINKLTQALESSNVDDAKATFSELFEHTLDHCKKEEVMMEEKQFPPYLAHKQEHDAAVDDMQKASVNFTETEDFVTALKYVELNLTPWFLQHTETMDAVTSMFLENSEVHKEYWDRLVPRK